LELIKPEIIEVSYVSDKKKLKGATPRVFVAPSPVNNDKELTALK
jgi:hypothetical protein